METRNWDEARAARVAGLSSAARAEYVAAREQVQIALRLGELVRRERESAGMSQRALADAAGMRQPAIARLEAGDVMPTLPTLERVAHALGRDLSVEMVAPRTGEGQGSATPSAVPFAPA